MLKEGKMGIRVVIGKKKGVKTHCRELTGMGWTSSTYASIAEAKKHNKPRAGARYTCKRIDTGKIVWKR